MKMMVIAEFNTDGIQVDTEDLIATVHEQVTGLAVRALAAVGADPSARATVWNTILVTSVERADRPADAGSTDGFVVQNAWLRIDLDVETGGLILDVDDAANAVKVTLGSVKVRAELAHGSGYIVGALRVTHVEPATAAATG